MNPRWSSRCLLLTCLLLGSCSTVYVAPQDATVPLVFWGPAWQVRIRDLASCEIKTVPRQAWSGIRVRPDRPLYVEHGIDGQLSKCRLAYTFVPKKGSSYFSESRLNDSVCSVEVFEMDASGRRRREPTTHEVRPPPC